MHKNSAARIYAFQALLLTALFATLASAQTAVTPPQRPPQPQPSATQPVIQRGTERRHQQFLDVAKQGDIDLLFIGDSITDNWRAAPVTRPVSSTRPAAPSHAGKPVWDQYFAPLKAANFGIGADRTQNVLWRMQNGELDGIHPKVIVLMLGTNNVSAGRAIRNTNAEVLDGMKLVINEIRTRQPQAKLLLMAIFPRGRTADDPYRQPIKEINTELARYDDGKTIFFMDITDKFLAPDGSIPMDVMPDAPALHPNEKGYQIWAEAIIGKVKELLAGQ
jgi:lysophospholipase L1-like esterase